MADEAAGETGVYRELLLEFVQDIEAVGGVFEGTDGLVRPVCDEDWIDLGSTYLKACAALGREPKINRDGDEDREE